MGTLTGVDCWFIHDSMEDLAQKNFFPRPLIGVGNSPAFIHRLTDEYDAPVSSRISLRVCNFSIVTPFPEQNNVVAVFNVRLCEGRKLFEVHSHR